MPQQGGQCPFCQLIQNPDQLLLVGESEHFYAWLEVNPRAKGHSMIVPKQHTENALEFSAEEWTEAFNLTREVVEKAKQGLGADGASITVNIEEAGGQMLPHAYIQVFPRFKEDENAGTPTGAIFPQRDDLQQQLDSIQQEMSSVSVDIGEEEALQAHPESQRFRTDSGVEERPEEPETESEKAEEQEATETGETVEDTSESEDLTRQELMNKLVESYGSTDALLKSAEFKQIISNSGFDLIEEHGHNNDKNSHNWL